MSEKLSSNSVFTQYSLNWHTEIALLAIIAFTSFFFLIFPSIDIWFSGLFFDVEDEFWAREEPVLSTFRAFGQTLVWITVLTSIMLVPIKSLWQTRFDLSDLQPPLFLLTTLSIGPGLIVSVILKDNWGRPRPWMTESFGGDFPYVPVWEISEFCVKNCSFVSGEASSAIWLISVAFLVPLVWRKAVISVVLILALLLSLNRIAFGGHFLSDTILSWGITLLVIRLGFRLIFTCIPKLITHNRLT